MPSPTPLTFSAHDFQPRCFALVPCAGVGERAGVGGPKQYHPVAGQAVVAHTLAALAAVARLDATLVVLSPNDAVFEQHVPRFDGDRAWVARVGGASRAESVANGLEELLARGAQPHDWVLVHDAARCLIQPEWVNRLIDECQDDELGGLRRRATYSRHGGPGRQVVGSNASDVPPGALAPRLDRGFE